MIAWLTAALLVTGSVFMFLAALGTLRFPDVYTRLHAATKAATFGASSVLLGVIVHFLDPSVTVRALLVVAFLFLTAPIAACMIARAAYFVGVPLWEGSVVDALREARSPSPRPPAPKGD